MADYFQILPSITLGKSNPTKSESSSHEHNSIKKTSSATSLPSHTLSRLVRGANDFFTPRQDAHAILEAQKLERKQILGLRMKNVGA